MNCQKCNSPRVARVSATCSDCCFVEVGKAQSSGYVPNEMGIGGSDYVEFKYCLDCGQIHGNFPLEKTSLEMTPEVGDPCPHCSRGEIEFVKPENTWEKACLACDNCDYMFFVDEEDVQAYLNQKEE